VYSISVGIENGIFQDGSGILTSCNIDVNTDAV